MCPPLRCRGRVDRRRHAGYMRIALVTESFYPATDGTTTTLKAVADRLVDTGHQVMVVAPGPGIGSYRGCPVVRIRPLEPRRRPGARRARRLPPRPRARHLPRCPGSQGAQAHPPDRHRVGRRRAGPGTRRGRRLLARQGRRPRRRGAGDVVVDGRPDGRVRRDRRSLAPRGRHRCLHPGAPRPVALRRMVPGRVGGRSPGRGRVRRRAAQAPRRTPAGRGGRDPGRPAGRHRRRSAARLARGEGNGRQAGRDRCRPAT